MAFATRHYRIGTGLSCNHPLIQAVQCCEYQILHRFYILLPERDCSFLFSAI